MKMLYKSIIIYGQYNDYQFYTQCEFSSCLIEKFTKYVSKYLYVFVALFNEIFTLVK